MRKEVKMKCSCGNETFFVVEEPNNVVLVCSKEGCSEKVQIKP